MGLLQQSNKTSALKLEDIFIEGSWEFKSNSKTPLNNWAHKMPKFIKKYPSATLWGMFMNDIEEFVQRTGYEMFMNHDIAAEFITKVVKYPGTKLGKQIMMELRKYQTWNCEKPYLILKFGTKTSWAKVEIQINNEYADLFSNRYYELIVYKDGTSKFI